MKLCNPRLVLHLNYQHDNYKFQIIAESDWKRNIKFEAVLKNNILKTFNLLFAGP